MEIAISGRDCIGAGSWKLWAGDWLGNECRSKHYWDCHHENELARVLLVREGGELPRWTDWIVNTLA